MEVASQQGQRLRRWLDSPEAPGIALIVLIAGATLLLLFIATKLSFYLDTWDFVLNRRSPTVDTLLQPHNEHIVLAPVLLEELLLAVFGMTSAFPEYALQTVALMATAVLLYVYAKRRVGGWPAVIAVALLLFVGAAWETILWPFEICFVGPILFGIAMLLALDREDTRGDILACVFLAIAIAFNSLGVAFIAAAFVDIAIKARGRGFWRRVWVFAIPALLYFGWYEGWGHAATEGISFDNLLNSPRYMLDCLAANLEAMFGLARPGDASLGWGRPLALLALVLVGVGQWLRPGFDRRLWAPLATLVLYFFLLALNHDGAREPNTSRYLYAGVAMLLLVGVNLLAGFRFKPILVAVAGGVAVVAVIGGLGLLKYGAQYLHGQAILTKTSLGAFEIARPVINPDFIANPELAGTASVLDVSAGSYYEAVDADGSPAYSPEEIATAQASAPLHADLQLAAMEELALEPQSGGWSATAPAGECVQVNPAEGTGGTEVRLATGANRIEVAPGAGASLYLRRFQTGEFPVALGEVAGGSAAALKIPKDNASAAYPWYLDVAAGEQARVCRPG
jgi:hypothetical protein